MSSQKNEYKVKTMGDEDSQNNARNVLPPKKRYQKPEAQKDKMNKSTVGIVAGVIRHTSSPDHCTGYFYTSSK